MGKRIAAAALALALAGCGGGGEQGERNTTTITASSPYVEQLKSLSEMNRGLALRRAIQDARNRCKRIEASGYQEDYKNMSMWTARCSDTGDWAIFIAPNADVQVRKCAEARQLGLPECRLPGAQSPASPSASTKG